MSLFFEPVVHCWSGRSWRVNRQSQVMVFQYINEATDKVQHKLEWRTHFESGQKNWSLPFKRSTVRESHMMDRVLIFHGFPIVLVVNGPNDQRILTNGLGQAMVYCGWDSLPFLAPGLKSGPLGHPMFDPLRYIWHRWWQLASKDVLIQKPCSTICFCCCQFWVLTPHRQDLVLRTTIPFAPLLQRSWPSPARMDRQSSRYYISFQGAVALAKHKFAEVEIDQERSPESGLNKKDVLSLTKSMIFHRRISKLNWSSDVKMCPVSMLPSDRFGQVEGIHNTQQQVSVARQRIPGNPTERTAEINRNHIIHHLVNKHGFGQSPFFIQESSMNVQRSISMFV